MLHYQLTPYQQKKCRDFFALLKENDYVYAGHLKSKISVKIETAYFILEDLKQQGFLKNRYEVYCFDCNHSKGIFLNSLEEFNSDFYCDFCGTSLSLEKNVIVLYQVIKI